MVKYEGAREAIPDVKFLLILGQTTVVFPLQQESHAHKWLMKAFKQKVKHACRRRAASAAMAAAARGRRFARRLCCHFRCLGSGRLLHRLPAQPQGWHAQLKPKTHYSFIALTESTDQTLLLHRGVHDYACHLLFQTCNQRCPVRGSAGI